MSLRILQVHNKYTQRGGEDSVLEQECVLLKKLGHTLDSFIVSNSDIPKFSLLQKSKLALGTIETVFLGEIKEKIRSFAPDVVMVYNTFPLLGFHFMDWISEQNIPVIKAIANYRVGCLNAEFFRSGRICQLCVERESSLPGIIHKCYHDSYLHSSGAYLFVSEFRRFLCRIGSKPVRLTYLNKVQADLLAGLKAPSSALFFKPNFIAHDPGVGSKRQNFGLFVGRLTAAKGLGDLLAAARSTDGHIKVVGAPVGSWIDAAPKNVEFLGEKNHTEVIELMKSAKFLIFPSKWFEGMPMVLLEALATGLPVLAPNLPTLQEIVPEGIVGWTYNFDRPGELGPALVKAFSESTETLARFSESGRDIFLSKYSADAQLKYMSDLLGGFALKI